MPRRVVSTSGSPGIPGAYAGGCATCYSAFSGASVSRLTSPKSAVGVASGDRLYCRATHRADSKRRRGHRRGGAHVNFLYEYYSGLAELSFWGYVIVTLL